MSNFTHTNRSFTNCETNEVFHLYRNELTDNYCLKSDSTKSTPGKTANNYYANNTGGSVSIKLNTGNIIELNSHSFYHIKDKEVITHIKYPFNSRFKKFV